MLVGGRFSNLYGRFRRYVTDIIDGSPITFDINTDIGSSLFFSGTFEKKEIDLCRRFIKKDSIVLDIGANIGIHSIHFSRMAEEGLVISFEPSPETFSVLLRNVRNFANILPINIGLSNSNSVADFYVADDNAYSGLKDTRRKEIKKIVKVFCFTLDEFLMGQNLKSIDFIKIDVEGLEQSVLEGMGRITEKYHPVIFCEIYKGVNSNEDPEKTVNYLIGKGYDALVFDGNGLIKYERHNDRFYNYLFLPRVGRQI